MRSSFVVGVLALQGDFREHIDALASVGVEGREVRTPADLDGVDALILPGGESTTISKLLLSSGLFDAITRRHHEASLPTMGTCAGMIVSAREIRDGRPDQRSFAVFDAVVRRNGIGRQVASFEAPVLLPSGDPFPAVFIRPPVVETTGPEVEVLAEYDGRPVLCAQGPHLFATFHPELTADGRIHQLFVDRIKERLVAPAATPQE